jgi:hypothetical protein
MVAWHCVPPPPLANPSDYQLMSSSFVYVKLILHG